MVSILLDRVTAIDSLAAMSWLIVIKGTKVLLSLLGDKSYTLHSP
jgi:hypothetical protein